MTKTERTDDLIHRWMNESELTGSEMRELINRLIDLRRAPARAHLFLATTEELFEELIRRTWNAKMFEQLYDMLASVGRIEEALTADKRPGECDHEWEPQSGGRTRCRKCLQWHHALCDHEWRTEFSYGSVVHDPFAPLPKRCIKCGVRIVPLT